MKRLAFFALLLLAPAPPKKPAWTILFYQDADCDLEEDMMNDLGEIAAAKASDRVNRVLLVDRAENDDDEGYSGEGVGGLENFHTAKRLIVENGALKEIDDLGEVNMGAQKTLADFIAWGVKAYPAEHYALVLSNHGDGWSGFASDESADDDMLDLTEISGALKQGGATFDLIGFDGCVMSTIEVAEAVRPYAKVFVASEELEPGYGWNFTPWLTALAEKPAMDAPAVAKKICDSFKDYFEKSGDADVKSEGKTITLAAVDLTKLADVVKAVDALASKVAAKLKGREAWIAIARARFGAEEYGKAADESNHLHDLHHLVRLLKGHGFDAECDAVAKAVEAAVLHRVAGEYRPEAHGLSIYFPSEKEIYDAYNEAATAKYAGPAKWTPMLEAYLAIEAADTDAPNIEGVASSKSAIATGESAEVTAKSTSDDVAEASFVLGMAEGDEQTLMGAVPIDAATDLKSTFDGKWLMLADAASEILSPIASYEKVTKDTAMAGVPAIYIAPNETDEHDVTLYFELTKGKGTYAYAYESNEFGATDIDIEEGGTIKPVYLTITAAGEREYRPVDNANSLKVGAEGLELERRAIPPGAYLVGFTLTDLAGNAREALAKIELKK